MNSQFTISRSAVEKLVREQMDSLIETASIDYELDTDQLERLGGDRTYMLYAVIDVQLKVPVNHLVETES